MFDFHTIHTIANGIKYYAESRAAFDKIFSSLSSQIRDKYYNRLSILKNEIQVDVAYTRKTEAFPLIAISLSEGSIEDTTFLGNAGHGGVSTQLINQECRINIYAKDMNDIRILHQIIMATLLLFKQSFFAIDYLDIRYIQSRDLEPIETLTSNQAVVYNREMIYMATQKIEVIQLPSDNAYNLPWELNPSIEEF
jgi:hypothetical protein